MPPRLVALLLRLYEQIQELNGQIKDIEADLTRQLKEDDAGGRLLRIPGIGPITASALAAEAGNASSFRSGGDFAASIRLMPWQDALRPWVRGLPAQRHSSVVACALANKLARIVWAVLARGGRDNPHPNAL